MNLFHNPVFFTAYANDVDALNPQWWAMESLVTLEENLVLANLVNKDYSDAFALAGEIVHVNKPGTFVAKHKAKSGNIVIQDATSSDTQVKLNQHLHASFALNDREVQASIGDLRNYFLAPAIRSIAEGIDAAIVGEALSFYPNAVGQIGVALTDDAVIDLGRVFDENLCPTDGRILVVGPTGKADLLKIDRFTDADKTGNQSALIKGMIGTVMGFDTFMSQTAGRNLSTAVTTTAETTNGTAAKGATSLVIDTAVASHASGVWFTIEGTDGIYRLTGALTGASTTAVPFLPALRGNVADGKTLTFYESDGDVKGAHTAGTTVDAPAVITDGYSAATEIPQVGQGVSFGTGGTSAVYTVTAVSGTYVNSSTEITLYLNRPLDAALLDDATVNVMPTGGVLNNFALRGDAVTLVNRPLAPASAGVAAAVQNNGSYSIRVTIGYDINAMKHIVTIDTLIGVKLLDVNQGAILIN